MSTDSSSIVERHSQERTRRLIASIDFRLHQNVFVVGLDNLDMIEGIFERLSDRSTLTLIDFHENDSTPDILGVERIRSLSRNPIVNMLQGTPDKIIPGFTPLFLSNFMLVANLANTVVITSPNLKRKQPEAVQEIFNALLEVMHQSATVQGNSVDDILHGVRNFVDSWPQFVTGMPSDRFRDAFKGTPCIIVGAGPSLDKNIHHLRAASERSLVFVVDSALKSVIGTGLIPDLVATIERTDKTLKFYNDLNHCDDMVFSGPNVIPAEILKKFSKKIFTGRSNDNIIRSVYDRLGYTNLDIGMNVAHVPLAIARHLGCDPIVFVGLDLAYVQGITHTREVFENLDQEVSSVLRERTVSVLGQHGEVLETFEYFLFAKKLIEAGIEADESRTYINATEGGARIIGTTALPLEAVVDALASWPVLSERLAKRYDAMNMLQEANSEAMTATVVQYFDEICRELKAIIERTEGFQKKLLTWEKNPRKKERINQRIWAQSDQLILGAASTNVIYLLMPILFTYYRELYSHPYQEQGFNKELYEKTVAFYENLITVADRIARLFEDHTHQLAESV